eukprot:PhF_6_TR9070/c0_g1_i2/m.14135
MILDVFVRCAIMQNDEEAEDLLRSIPEPMELSALQTIEAAEQQQERNPEIIYEQLKREANGSLAILGILRIRQELASRMDYEKLYMFKKLLEIYVRCTIMQNDEEANALLQSIPETMELSTLRTIEEMSRIVYLYYRLTQLKQAFSTGGKSFEDILHHMESVSPILKSRKVPPNFWEHIGEPIEKWLDPLETILLRQRESTTISELAKVFQLTSGHAYKCPNGHLYFIGECGGATETSRCPDCGFQIGGQRHRVVEGNVNVNVVNGEKPAYGYNLGAPPHAVERE